MGRLLREHHSIGVLQPYLLAQHATLRCPKPLRRVAAVVRVTAAARAPGRHHIHAAGLLSGTGPLQAPGLDQLRVLYGLLARLLLLQPQLPELLLLQAAKGEAFRI